MKCKMKGGERVDSRFFKSDVGECGHRTFTHMLLLGIECDQCCAGDDES